MVIGLNSPKLWDLDTPNLYHLRATWLGDDGHTDTRNIPFGFRWFAPSGLGTDAIFRLNGRRIKLYSSISWGFWGLNGLFPTPELAEKEVTQARKLNLNCLNFHRNVGKEEVFRAHDRLGLLRYMEPGAGKLAIGAPAPTASGEGAIANPGIVLAKPESEADKFAQRFMIAKCVHMVRTFRSHPSLIQYTLQNEIGADLKNPDTLAILAAMRAEDPSRTIALNDGFSPRHAPLRRPGMNLTTTSSTAPTKRSGATGGTITRAQAINGTTSSTSRPQSSSIRARTKKCSPSSARWKVAPLLTTTL
jgi:beta-galactosidase